MAVTVERPGLSERIKGKIALIFPAGHGLRIDQTSVGLEICN